MPIPLRRPYELLASQISLKDNLYKNDKPWVAWWYGGIYKNSRDQSQPNVVVSFRELTSEGLSDSQILRQVPITSLGQLRLGSIWEGSTCKSQLSYESQTFKVNFTAGSWKFSSFSGASALNIELPYDLDTHPLFYDLRDQSKLIEFPISTGGKLVVPCLEFFSRCYGYSQEIKRILTTYFWDVPKGAKERLFAPINRPEVPNLWQVRLRERLCNDDITLLAHIKYDQYTLKRVKKIHADLATQFNRVLKDPNGKPIARPAFLEAAPWFEGDAELEVEGIWFNDTKSFLGLRITGCSEPGGLTIEGDRTNNGKAERSAPPGSPTSWDGVPRKIISHPPIPFDVTGFQAPDHASGTVDIKDPKMKILGKRRRVIHRKTEEASTTPGAVSEDEDSKKFSSGEPGGTGKGTGRASIKAEAIMESKGTLRDMWNALLYLRDEYPEVIKGVESYTGSEGFSSEEEPKLVSLTPFDDIDDSKEITTAMRSWVYTSYPDLRGVLAARITTVQSVVYLFEITRKPRLKTIKDISTEGEENYQGFMFTLKDNDGFQSWLDTFTAEIRKTKGVVKKLLTRCPGKAEAFNHRMGKQERVAHETTAKKALQKFGIVFPNAEETTS
ncbi:hypothetical protein [Cellvibrio fibrivorans]|uniref:Uncharacterized protein n=1 Tax=Cellvibrio fibrivorans TaxID=126350 RepID=A0ABU1UTP0_9GAMM|nr:hypothetical protein [Cellvibrio fibrivorans]MDR7088545.1 hypothetical protein [Cellvibrio fibrivorans]